MTWFDTGGNTPPFEPPATGSRAGDPRKAANGDWFWHEMLEVPFVLANGTRVFLMLPPNGLSQADAVRMAAAVVAWAVPEDDDDA